MRRSVGLLLAGLALGVLGHGEASAHAILRLAEPMAGATLGDTPRALRLSFSEKPEASLSIVRVVDTDGAAYQVGQPEPVSGDPLSLVTRIRPLGRGVYTVSWRVVSSFDGHATSGAYAFGVRVSPAVAVAAAAQPAASRFEMLARGILLLGLVVLLGAAAAEVAQFGDPSDLTLAAGGWVLACGGLILLASAQWRGSGASLGDVLATPFGRALIRRAIALGIAGCALLAARWTQARTRRGVMAVALLAVAALIAVHVSAGHAAASRLLPSASIAVQWAHFAAAGIWVGGLAALLWGVRGTPSAAKEGRVRRFSSIAAVLLLVVAVTGVVRALEGVPSWSELASTSYGRGVSAKIALLIIIAAFGALNRWRSVPAAAISLRPLRRTAAGELAFAAAALGTAAILGSLPPPSGGAAEPPRLVASGIDFGTTVRVSLTAPSDQPGPNSFVVHAVDYDSKIPLRPRRVSLRFAPLDDPDIAPSLLPLVPAPGDAYVGSGANLAFDGRWRVTVEIETGRDSVAVPLDVEVRNASRSPSIERIPGQAASYTIQVPGGSFLRISPDPGRAGRNRITVTCFGLFGEERPVERMIVTVTASDGSTRQLSARRSSEGAFVAEAELRKGRSTIAAIARAIDGARLRAAVDLDVPGR